MADNELTRASTFFINVVLNALSALVTIVFNSLTIQAIRKTSSLPEPFKTLLLNLAVSDLAVGLVAQPLSIAFELGGCRVTNILWAMQFALVDVSFLGITALSLDRFLAVHLHLRYPELVTHKRVLGLVILAWVLGAILSFVCAWIINDDRSKLVNIKIILWSLCFIFVTVTSFRLYFAVRLHANQIQASQVQQAAHNGELANTVRLTKSTVNTFYVYFVFLVCYLPFFCSLLAKQFFEFNLNWYKDFSLYCRTLMFVNSSLNPIIYCWRMSDVRHSVKDLMRNIIARLKCG